MSQTVAVVEAKREKHSQEGKRKELSDYQMIYITPNQIKDYIRQGVAFILVNLHMPNIDSIELIKAVKDATEHATVPIIFLQESGSLEAAISQFSLQCITSGESTQIYKSDKWRSVSIREIAQGMDVSLSTLARIVGVSERNLSRWINEETRPKGIHERNLQKLQYVYYLLTRALSPKAISKYIHSSNPNLAGRSPLMVLEGGDFASVESDLLQLIEGVYV